MVRLLEIEDDDDSIERVNLDDYNSDDYKEYLSDEDMLNDPATAQMKTPDYRNPPPPPLAVMVIMKLEDDDREVEMVCRRIRNQKQTERLHNRLQEDVGESHDYSNNDLRNVINIERDTRTVIISKRQEREEAEAYCPSSNYRIIDNHQKQTRKSPNIRAHDSNAGPSRPALLPQQGRKVARTQECFERSLHKRCLLTAITSHFDRQLLGNKLSFAKMFHGYFI